MPGYLYRYPRFKEELELPIVQKEDEEATARLQEMIRSFVLLQLKKDVLKNLSDKPEENPYAVMGMRRPDQGRTDGFAAVRNAVILYAL